MSGGDNLTVRKTVEQLRRELNLERCKISQVSADLQTFCEQNVGSDYLLTGVLPNGVAMNPYKEKKIGCSVI